MSTNLWPEGQYRGTLASFSMSEASTGTPMLYVKFKVAAGDSNVAEKTVRMAISEKTIGSDPARGPRIAQRQLNTLGFNGEWDDDKMAFSNPEVDLYCRHQEYKGEQKEEWSVSGDYGKPLDKDKIAQLKANWRAHNGAPTPSKAPAPSSPPPAAKPASRAPSPAPAPAVVKDRDWCWGQFEEYCNANNKPVDATSWAECIQTRAVNAKKHESKFNGDDWQEVCELFDIPF